jgi:UDP-GlcNAc:undecaprenyl-phosphate GlcNAc-1-phosphate transferase
MALVLISSIVSIVIFAIGRLGSKHIWLLDKPWPDVPRRNSVPTVLWICALLSFTVIYIIRQKWWYTWQPYVIGLIAGSRMIGLFALVDELLEIKSRNLAIKWDKTQWIYIISPKFKAIIQIIIVMIALRLWWLYIPEFAVGSIVLHFPLWLWYLIAIVWCVWFINAVNRFDGVYGLVSGIASIGFLTLYILVSIVVMWSYQVGPEYAKILTFVSDSSLILSIISLISLVVEYKPLWLLRDVGTMFFGFTLAYLSLLWWAKIGTIMVVLSLVLFDAVRVLINRIRKNKNPFQWDYTHLHHRLLANGWTRWEIRVWIRSRSLFFMILILLQWTNRINKLIIFVLMMIIFFGINLYLFWIKKIPDHLTIQNKQKGI